MTADLSFTQDLRTALSESRASLDATWKEEMEIAAEATAQANRQIAEQQQAIDDASAKLLALDMNGLSVEGGVDETNNGVGVGSAVDRQNMEEQVQKQQVVNEKLEASLQAQKAQMEGAWTAWSCCVLLTVNYFPHSFSIVWLSQHQTCSSSTRSKRLEFSKPSSSRNRPKLPSKRRWTILRVELSITSTWGWTLKRRKMIECGACVRRLLCKIIADGRNSTASDLL